MKEVVFKIPSIACSGCENSLKIAFSNVEGVIKVEPSHKTKTMKVVFDETKIDLETIKKIIKKTGKEVVDE